MANDKTQGRQDKQVYERPVVRRYPLRSDEAVLGYCKTISSGSFGQQKCGPGLNCTTVGS
jgi:hypothetical protein